VESNADELREAARVTLGEESSGHEDHFAKTISNFSPRTKYDLPTTEAIFRPLFDDLVECANTIGLLSIREVELVTSTSISPTPLALPTSATHQLFVGPGTSAFCNYWAKVYTAIVKAIGAHGSGPRRVTSSVDLKNYLSHDPSGLLLAMRLSIYYAATGTLLGFGTVVQPSEYTTYRLELLRAMEVFALAHEYSHFLLHERRLQVADEEGNESNLGLEFFCDAIGLQLSREWGSKNNSWIAFTGAGGIAFFRAFDTTVNCATQLAECAPGANSNRSRSQRMQPQDSHPSPRERALTLMKWAVEKTVKDQREAVESFLAEFDLICASTGAFVLDILREAKVAHPRL
jgi:hypothetical protein